MKAILVDDELLAIEALKSLIEKIGGVEIKGAYTNPEKALEALERKSVDVIFLDIEMGASHGMGIAKIIQRQHENVKIIFVTAHAEFAVEAFEVQAFDYLLKPIRIQRLQEAIVRVKETLDTKQEEQAQLYVQSMQSFKLSTKQSKEIKWRTRKVKELFAYLWHHSPNPVPRSRIMEDLWHEQHIDSAVQLMHTSFYHLRKTIRDLGFNNPVQFSNEQYLLNVRVASDVEILEKYMQADELSEEEIDQMMRLYEGNYLEEEDYEWAVPKQEQLKRQFLAILEKFAEDKMAKDDLSVSVATCLEKMVALDPYNERFVYLLIDYYGKKKNLQKVIKVAGRFGDVWRKELGIDIPEEISSIYYKYITETS